MLRVIRNHRAAVYDSKEYENLSINPHPINQNICPLRLLQAAHDSWDRALQLGEQYGYKNAQVTVIAPTGTIGLVMDCDTTGVEPDYALVKYKKLAGGGFFKIVNQSVPKALKKLGYDNEQIHEIISYCLGHGSLEKSPVINKKSLLDNGLDLESLDKIEGQLKNAMDIRHCFNQWNINENIYRKIIQSKQCSFLTALGYTEEDIDSANDFICGTMMLEGAPHLKEEHYPIFDCANKCGSKGKRFIHPYGHLKMLAATQPFISGAISKTINMPNEWTIEQIKKAYYDAWKMMTKGVALYRDGCKLSQPLNTTLEDSPELKKSLEEIEERKEERRDVIVKEIIRKKIKIGPKVLTLSADIYVGKISEISYKIESLSIPQQTMMDALIGVINLNLQSGLNPSLIAERSLNIQGNPLITELSDFLTELEEENTFNKESLLKRVEDKNVKNEDNKNNYEEDKNDESSSEEKCSSCGASQLRQNGTCMLCEVCGETTGCS